MADSAVVPAAGQLWLNRADAPSDALAVSMQWGSALSWPVLDGANRRYAGGVMRPVVVGDATGVILADVWKPVTGVLTWAQLVNLRARVGVTQIARDVMGQRIACVLWAVEPTLGGPARGSAVSGRVQLTLERTDFLEGA